MSFLPDAKSLGLADLVHLQEVTSTMDVAHAAAANGAPAGTLFVADSQTVGRGRGGKSWHSAPDDGLWCTLIERPVNASGLDVLSLRLGLALASALEPFIDSGIRVKWPNDLYVGNGKLAGILVEARWREGALDWVAVGIGVNLRRSEQPIEVATLRSGTTRTQVLERAVKLIRSACTQYGPLSEAERAAWIARDLTIGREINEPVIGVVRGLANDGSLLVQTAEATLVAVRAGSLVFAKPLSFDASSEQR